MTKRLKKALLLIILLIKPGSRNTKKNYVHTNHPVPRDIAAKLHLGIFRRHANEFDENIKSV